MRTIERAQAEIESGRLWRAKELLQGTIANVGYNVELYQAYGRLLMLMGDLRAAGKFLFLSGVRSPELEEQINLYLRKFGGSPRQLYQSFPRKARLIVLSTYPPAVENDLRRFGFPNNLSLFPGAPVSRDDEPGQRVSPFSWLLKIVFVLFILVLLVLLALGWIKFKELDHKYPFI